MVHTLTSALLAGLIVAASASPIHAATITVAADGSGDYRTIQEAVAAAPAGQAATIHIKAGDYRGPVWVPKSKTRLTLEGDGPEKTIITWDHNVNDPPPPGAGQFDPGVHIFAEDFSARDLTIRNISGDHGQALALRIDADRAVLRNCRILGWQDTLMVNNGRQYFRDCYIEGRVDFIYGSGTAVFDHCEIHSKNGGFLTAASTPESHPFGLVFLDCKLTGDDVPWNPASTNPASTMPRAKPSKLAYLGRPWLPFGAVAFIRCEMGDHIQPAGWHNWGKPASEKTARYVEFRNTGPGADTSKRVSWSRQLTAEEAQAYTVDAILGGADHWKPAE